MSRNHLIAAILILAGLLIWLLWRWDPATPSGAWPVGKPRPLTIVDAPRGGDFKLTGASGPVSLRRFRGQVVLIYFGYTACPDVCPTNLAFIAGALEGLTASELDHVRVLFISVDPERDTPARLADYVAFFHPNILGLTGTPEQLAYVARLYGAAYRKVEHSDSAMGYLVDHSAYTYLVDPQGRLVRALDHATSPDQILAALRQQLAGSDVRVRPAVQPLPDPPGG